MTTWLLLAVLAGAEPVVLAVAGLHEIDTRCVEEHPDELDRCKGDPLQHTDEDAWRAALVFGAVVGPDRVAVVLPKREDDRSPPPPLDPGWVQVLSDGGPRLGDLVDAVGQLRHRTSGPLELTLFLSAHGTSGGVHLESGEIAYDELRDALVAAAGPGSRLVLLVADVCQSGTFKGRGALGGVRSIVTESRVADVDIVVDSPTPEESGLAGGAFTRLVLSSMAGAGDLNRDGVIRAQELANTLEAYRLTLSKPLIPTVRTPNGDADVPIEGFVDPAGTGTLTLGGDGDDARWLINRIIGDAELPMWEVVTEGGESADLAIPPGTYSVWRLGFGAWFGQGCPRVEVARGAAVQLAVGAVESACAFTRYTLPWTKGAETDPALPDVPREVLEAWPMLVPPDGRRHSHRFFAGSSAWVFAGPYAESAILQRGGSWVGGSASVLWPADEGRVHLLLDARGAREVGAAEPSVGASGAVGGAYDRALASTQIVRVGAFLRLGVGGVNLRSEAGGATSVTPLLDLGLSGTLSSRSWRLRMEVAVAPREPQVRVPSELRRDGEASTAHGDADLSRGLAGLAIGRAF